MNFLRNEAKRIAATSTCSVEFTAKQNANTVGDKNVNTITV
jgi:hypothetical protein